MEKKENKINVMSYVKYVFLILIFLSCKQFNMLVDGISNDQKKIVKLNVEQDLQILYKPITKNIKKILKKLFTELEKEGKEEKNLQNFKILNTYSPGSATFSGIIWNENFAYTYNYKFDSQKLLTEEQKSNFAMYKKSSNIDLRLITFLDTLEQQKDLEKLPAFGKSNSAVCIFSKISRENKENILIKSFAFRER